MKCFRKYQRRATLTPTNCADIATDIEAEVQNTMDIEWAKVTIFTPDRESKNIKVEDLYLTLLIRTIEPDIAGSKIKEICGAMHLVDTHWPMPFGVNSGQAPSRTST